MHRVELPTLGGSMEEGKVLCWSKLVGDRIEVNDSLAEIETDKVNVVIPAPASGVLRAILVAEGKVVPVGTLLAVIGEAGEALPEDLPGQPVEVRQRCVEKEKAKEKNFRWMDLVYLLGLVFILLDFRFQDYWWMTLLAVCMLIFFSFSLGVAFQKWRSKRSEKPVTGL